MQLDLTQENSPREDVVSVSRLLRSARDLIERRFPLLWVAGEICDVTPARSGHLYFVLKDEQAQVDCVMFRSRAALLDWTPREGMRVEVRALVTLYEPRGRFQLNIEGMRQAGLGPLYERFLRLKAKLEREGLFEAAAKTAIPAHARSIGVLTSLHAAALRDVLTTLARRNPSLPVIVYPVPVQGEGAAGRIARMLATANERAECDVLLLVRGGGSIEDLWAFNEELLARALRRSQIPVVVGIGHETDFTIADFAADCRAPTPTAAAELVSPSRAELLARTAELAVRATREALRRIAYAMQSVDVLARRLVHPAERLRASRQLVAQLAARLASGTGRRLDAFLSRVALARTNLQSLDPTAVLSRGYSITVNASGEVLRTANAVKEGERVKTTLAKGWIESEVRRKG
ncbi:MAG TPA: exodeoxyribonuclease VII large subunit [Burkholderiales bacterium]|jgi:exodeoxyribonuclease VII large subunit|nr:exodeoxyribonuclease VII large subunit [Burkholderiales bacterium]